MKKVYEAILNGCAALIKFYGAETPPFRAGGSAASFGEISSRTTKHHDGTPIRRGQRRNKESRSRPATAAYATARCLGCSEDCWV